MNFDLRETLLDLVRELKPEVDKRHAAAAADLAVRRRALMAERPTVAATAEAAAARYKATDEQLAVGVDLARAGLGAALERRAVAAARYREQSFETNRRLEDIGNELRATAPAVLGVLRGRLHDLHEAAHQAGVVVLARNRAGYLRRAWGNGESVQQRVDGLVKIASMLSLWAVECADDAEVDVRFRAAVAALPAVDGRVPQEWRDAGAAVYSTISAPLGS